MNELQAIILGIIQGLTEFLPVSSSGHIEIGKEILGIKVTEDVAFTVAVHAATALSTIVVFRKDIWFIIKELFKFRWNESTSFVVKIFVSILPVALVGVLWKDEIEASVFHSSYKMLIVGSLLVVTGLLLLFTYYAKQKDGKVTFGRAIIMGIAQAIAVLPGISRSGATIATGILSGTDKSAAARFSFLMVLIPIFGAAALEFKDLLGDDSPSIDISPLALSLGFLAAFISGLIACNWMIKLVRQGKLIYFAIYCFVIGAVAISYSLLK